MTEAMPSAEYNPLIDRLKNSISWSTDVAVQLVE